MRDAFGICQRRYDNELPEYPDDLEVAPDVLDEFVEAFAAASGVERSMAYEVWLGYAKEMFERRQRIHGVKEAFIGSGLQDWINEEESGGGKRGDIHGQDYKAQL